MGCSFSSRFLHFRFRVKTPEHSESYCDSFVAVTSGRYKPMTKTPYLLKLIFPNRIWEGAPQGKRLYLSFDDGPIPEVTPWVLETLHKYQAKALFFCIGDNVRKHPEIFKNIIAHGHGIGNHTFHHLKGWGCNRQTYVEDVLKAQREFEKYHPEAYPEKRHVFRPPYGKMTLSQARELQNRGFSIIMWDILTKDYRADLDPQEIFLRIKKHTRPGSILVFHDSLKAQQNLRAVLPQVLEYYFREGYQFDLLEI